MCMWCNGFYRIVESEKIDNVIWMAVGNILDRNMIRKRDNSVFIEVRNGQGYIRLGDREEMQCLDHCETVKINYCPNCGRKFKRDTITVKA